MLDPVIYDYQLSQYLHGIIRELPIQQQAQLKTLSMCGHKIIKPSHGKSGVFVLSNGKESKLFGNTMCKNPFACPCCSAHRMSIYSAQIGKAIDEMKKRGYFGFMMTFTIPHLRYMSCREVTDILYNTYSYYRRTAKQKYKSPNKKGTISGQFYADCKIEHNVTVCEYTYGKNGWHPHFHGIFWTKKENAEKVMKWQEKLNAFWVEQAHRYTVKYWQEHRKNWTEEKIKSVANNLYRTAEKDAGIYISNVNGVISESQSSEYIAGWGANREVTGNYRKMASHAGHKTPYQILEAAYNGSTLDRDLYIDYCLAVTLKPVHHRVIWSRTGIKAVVIQAEQVEKSRELLKKKETDEWKVVCWFDRQQWAYVIELNKTSPIIANILYLAKTRKEILLEFLDGMGVEYELPEKHYFSHHIENIFNVA